MKNILFFPGIKYILFLIPAVYFSSCSKETTVCTDPDLHEDNKGIWLEQDQLPVYIDLNESFHVESENYLMVGNIAINNFSYRCHFYDKASGSWTITALFPSTWRYGVAVFSIDDKFYFAGGRSGSSYLNQVWMFDPVTNTWTQKANLPDFRCYSVGESVNGFGFILGGNVNNVNNVDVVRYDPLNDVWNLEQTVALPIINQKFNSLVIGDEIYIYSYNGFKVYHTLNKTLEEIYFPMVGNESCYIMMYTDGRFLYAPVHTSPYRNSTNQCGVDCDKIYRFDPVSREWALNKKYKRDNRFMNDLRTFYFNDKIYFANGTTKQLFEFVP